MRILWLAKRQTTGQDSISARFGRLFHLPRELGRRGHQVCWEALSYQPRRSVRWVESSFQINSTNLFPSFGVSYWRHLLSSAQTFRPEVVVGSSDIPYLILAAVLAARLGVPYIVDLFDNFESYQSYHLPGAARGFRKALAGAKFISCVSESLAVEISQRHPSVPVVVLENGVDPEFFRPGAKVSGPFPVFGYAGALSENRGLSLLFAAWPEVRKTIPQARLRMVGKKHSGFPRRFPEGITYEGRIAHQKMREFLSQIDIALVPTQAGTFGSYAFPIKFYEALACGVPVLTSDQGPLGKILADYPELTFKAGDQRDLASRMITLAQHSPKCPALLAPSWKDLAERWEDAWQRA